MPNAPVPLAEISERDKARFWAKVQRGEPSDCWPWLGGKKSGGYGHLFVDKRLRGTHRLAYQIAHDQDPLEMCVLHTCDNPPCCNPTHLWLGTHADNCADKVRKGRQAKGDRSGPRLHPERMPRGIKHNKSKLTNAKVRKMRDIRETRGIGYVQLGKRFGITHAMAWRIVNRKAWVHVT